MAGQIMSAAALAKNPKPTGQNIAFELNSADGLRDALWWLNQAYEAAK